MDKPRISYASLQKKYSGKIVALSKNENKVIDTASSFPALINKLKEKNINPQDCVYVGPVGEYGTVTI